MEQQIVGYARVSTQRQGESGLGLDAQRAFIEAYAVANRSSLVAVYTEVETGKRDDLRNRPELRKALAHARRLKARLVIAKLDRLARSVYVTAELHRSGVDFIACDNPSANRLTVQILAAVAEDEARRISDRTKAALQVAKARGTKLGTPENLTQAARLKGADARRRSFQEFADSVAPRIRKMHDQGLSLREVATALNEQGVPARKGGLWTAVGVQRVLKA
jgi:DNA invertase Pin-like site-specific DNA recombinase